MNIEKEINEIIGFKNLELLAKQVVEGFISGLHKSPFHGFSAEFAEHKIYNNGESTKHIDWKLFAKTDKLYTKRYEEETNLRCHLIVDNSSSMHYPNLKQFNINSLNKIGFSVLASAAIMNLMKRQRDAVGLSIYSDDYEFYASEKGSERHHQMLLQKLNEALLSSKEKSQTKTYEHLHLIAEKLKRRSLVFLFTDMFQSDAESHRGISRGGTSKRGLLLHWPRPFQTGALRPRDCRAGKGGHGSGEEGSERREARGGQAFLCED